MVFYVFSTLQAYGHDGGLFLPVLINVKIVIQKISRALLHTCLLMLALTSVVLHPCFSVTAKYSKHWYHRLGHVGLTRTGATKHLGSPGRLLATTFTWQLPKTGICFTD